MIPWSYKSYLEEKKIHVLTSIIIKITVLYYEKLSSYDTLNL